MDKVKVKSKKHHEPLIHITKRDDIAGWKSLLIHVAAFLIALLLCGIFIACLTGLNPLEIYVKMFEGTYGGKVTRMESINKAAMLLGLSLAVTPAFKMRFWNIGAEGQALMGGFAAAYCMLEFGKELDGPLLLGLMFVASVAAGIIWALIPAVFQAYFKTNETLFTLMMNYVAMTLVSYYIMVKDRSGRSDLGILNERTGAGYFPKLFGQDYLLNIIIVLLMVVVVFIYLKYSKHGYEISVVGESQNTARYIGLNVKKVVIRTLCISGAICGLTGLMLVAGSPTPILKENIVGGMGFTAILASWMAQFNPLVMVPVSAMIVWLSNGSASATDAFKIDSSIGDLMTAIVIFSIIACEFFSNYQINFRSKRGESK